MYTAFSDSFHSVGTFVPTIKFTNYINFMSIWCPNSEKYADKTTITLKEVEDEGFISLMGSRQFRAICDKFCHHAGIRPRVILESDSPSAVRNMIAANLGVGFWPAFTWGDAAHDRVRLLEITDPMCRRDIVISRQPIKADGRNVEDFFQFLTDFFRKLQ